jgi:hypothetical protein
MKKLLLLCFVAALLLVGCGEKESPGLKLDPPDWARSETSRYQVLLAGEPSGEHVLQLDRTVFGSVKVLQLVAQTRVTIPGAETTDSTWLVMHQDNLRPIRSVRSIVSGMGNLGADVLYSKSQARVIALTTDGEQTADVPISPFDFDNEQITTLLRALPLKLNVITGFNSLVGIGGAVIPVEAVLLDTQTITVPAGEFECNHIQVTIAGQNLGLWYEIGGTRRMIRYAVAASELVMELLAPVTPEPEPEPTG